MEAALRLKKQVSSDQVNALVQFLKENPELAKGTNRGRRGKLSTFKLWNACARKLNVYKDGPAKDGKGWSKYWCDMKYRIRKRALEIRAAEEQEPAENQEPAEPPTPLTPLEEEVLELVGRHALNTIVIKMDPLGQIDPDNDEGNLEKTSDAELSGTESEEISGKKRQHTNQIADLVDNGECSKEKKPKLYRTEDDSGRDEAAEFLRLEREKLEYAKKTSESLQVIAPAITRLVDVMSQIRDALVNNRINL